jgi:hypothetical protein
MILAVSSNSVALNNLILVDAESRRLPSIHDYVPAR